MKKYRYGKFKARDWWILLYPALIFILLSALCLIAQLHILFAVFSIILAVIWIYVIVDRKREKFIIQDDCIITVKGKKENKILLQSELILIITYADFCPPLTVKTPIGNQTHILRGRYSVSILQQTSTKDVIEALNKSLIKEHTDSSIRNLFYGYRYVYSFVFDSVVLNDLIKTRSASVIVLKSLSDKVTFSNDGVKVYEFG